MYSLCICSHEIMRNRQTKSMTEIDKQIDRWQMTERQTNRQTDRLTLTAPAWPGCPPGLYSPGRSQASCWPLSSSTKQKKKINSLTSLKSISRQENTKSEGCILYDFTILTYYTYELDLTLSTPSYPKMHIGIAPSNFSIIVSFQLKWWL